MLAIPLPFAVALLLGLLALRVGAAGLARREVRWQPTVAFLIVCAAMATMTGLRWTTDIPAILFFRPIVASLLLPVSWICFGSPASEAPAPGTRSRVWLWARQAVPVLIVGVFAVAGRRWIDLVLAFLFIGYGAALLRLARRGPDAWTGARLSAAPLSHKAAIIAGSMLIWSGLIDGGVALDLWVSRGAHLIVIVGYANVVTLLGAALSVALLDLPPVAEPVGPEAEEPDTPPIPPLGAETAADAAILAAVDRLMQERRLYRDPDLTLDRLARRAGIPARQISAAINRVRGCNVSQAVNGYRVAEAQRLLRETGEPVTTVMFEAGFQTKSNFNREFRRVTGQTPSVYRQGATNAAAGAAPLSESR